MKDTILEAQNLDIGYTGGGRSKMQVIATGIQASLHSGEIVCLVGPNGAGKSTLIRTLAGMQPPLKGQVLIAGEPIQRLPPHRLARRLGVVLTEKVEVGNLNAYALAALGRHPYTDWLGNLDERDHAAVHHALEAVGALHLAQRSVMELSDGERQKIMIARALAQEPDVILLDEPTAFLDLPHRVEILQTLRELARTSHKGILLSIHDLDLALRSADALWLLPSGGPLQVGAPEDLVMGGAFEEVFGGHGVDFDPVSGSFKFKSAYRRALGLKGQGLVLIWTRRALERAGYLIRSESDISVEIQTVGRTHNWRITGLGTEKTCCSIYELLELLILPPDQGV
jgi:iron complex transport system ATP-binding protein